MFLSIGVYQHLSTVPIEVISSTHFQWIFPWAVSSVYHLLEGMGLSKRCARDYIRPVGSSSGRRRCDGWWRRGRGLSIVEEGRG